MTAFIAITNRAVQDIGTRTKTAAQLAAVNVDNGADLEIAHAA